MEHRKMWGMREKERITRQSLGEGRNRTEERRNLLAI